MSESWALQQAIVQRLLAVPDVAAMVGARVYDNPLPDVAFPFVSIGASDVVPSEAGCFGTAVQTVQVDVWSRAKDGKRECKILSDRVFKALHQFEIDLSVGALSLMRVVLLRVLDDADGITSHGVVQVECTLELVP